MVHVLHVLPSLSLSCFNYLLFYFWLRWVFIALRRLSPVAARGDYSFLKRVGFSHRGAQALGVWASVVAAHGP